MKRGRKTRVRGLGRNYRSRAYRVSTKTPTARNAGRVIMNNYRISGVMACEMSRAMDSYGPPCVKPQRPIYDPQAINRIYDLQVIYRTLKKRR